MNLATWWNTELSRDFDGYKSLHSQTLLNESMNCKLFGTPQQLNILQKALPAVGKTMKLFQQRHASCVFILSGLDSIEVNPARKIGCVKTYQISSSFFVFIYKSEYFFA